MFLIIKLGNILKYKIMAWKSYKNDSGLLLVF